MFRLAPCQRSTHPPIELRGLDDGSIAEKARTICSSRRRRSFLRPGVAIASLRALLFPRRICLWNRAAPRFFGFGRKREPKQASHSRRQPRQRHIHRDAMCLYIVSRYVASRSISGMIAANASYRPPRAFQRARNRRRAALRAERWPAPLFEDGLAARRVATARHGHGRHYGRFVTISTNATNEGPESLGIEPTQEELAALARFRLRCDGSWPSANRRRPTLV